MEDVKHPELVSVKAEPMDIAPPIKIEVPIQKSMPMPMQGNIATPKIKIASRDKPSPAPKLIAPPVPPSIPAYPHHPTYPAQLSPAPHIAPPMPNKYITLFMLY